MKKCFKCNQEKERKEFYRHSEMGDGLLGKCKDCTKSDAAEVRNKKIDYYREYDRCRGSRQTKEYAILYKERWPVVRRSHGKVARAVRSGKLKKEKCECGEKRVVAHHDDYSKPLEIKWMCQACHIQWHKKNGPGKNKNF